MRKRNFAKEVIRRAFAVIMVSALMTGVIPIGETAFAAGTGMQEETEILEEQEETVSDNTVFDGKTERVRIDLDGALQFGDLDIREPEIHTVTSEGIVNEGHVSSSTVTQKIYRGLLAYDACIDISQYRISTGSIESVFVDVLNEYPDLYYVQKTLEYDKSCGYVVRLWPTYKGANEYWATGFDKNYYTQGVNDCLECVNDSMSDLEKIVAVHEWIVLNCTYDFDSLEKEENGTLTDMSCFSSYGVFGKGTAVCQGYAMAYKLIMNCLGIECYYVTNSGHGWNLVKLDGKYYHVDTTWDDPKIYGAEGTYAQKYGYVGHKNLLRSDAGMKSTNHNNYTINGMKEQNVATSTKYDSYFWQSSDSRLVGTGSGWLYVDSSNKLIGSFNRSTGSSTTVKSLSTWPIKGTNKYYDFAFSMLAEKNGVVYYSTPNNIISMDKNGNNSKTVYTNTSSTDTIWGFIIENGKFIIDLSNKPSDACDGIEITITGAGTTPPTELILDVKDLTLVTGDTWDLYYSYYPSYATEPKVSYSSNNTSVATVNSSGTISAVSKGTATITASTGSLSDTVKVTVVDITPKPTAAVSIDGGTAFFTADDGGSYSCDKAKSTEVTLQDSVSNAVIYYTTDDTEPDESSDVYSAPIRIDGNKEEITIKYMAVSDGLPQSETAEIAIQMVDCTLKVSRGDFEMDNKSTVDIEITKLPELLSYSDISISADEEYLEVNTDDIDDGVIHVKALKKGDTELEFYCSPCTVGTTEITLKITIIPAKIPVRFYDPYGNLIDEQKVDEECGATEPQFRVPVGYEFNGWDTTFDYITDVTEVHAKPYLLKNYSITYLGLPDDSDYIPSALSYTIEDEVVLLPAADKDVTHIFSGWNTKENGSGAEIDIIRRGSYGDIVVYAQYEYIGGLRIDPIADRYYTGKKIKPEVVVRYDDRVLKEGKDYKVKYSNNKKPGTATVTIKGKGSYTGKDTTTFNIFDGAIPAGDISSAEVSLSNCVFNGTEQLANEDAQLTLKVDGITRTLLKGEDYVIDSHTDNINAGRAFIVYRGIGDYCGELVKTYRISSYDIGGSMVKIHDLDEQPYEKDGSTPDVKISFVDGNGDEIILKRGIDYTLSFSKNKKVSKRGRITIQGKGNFAGKLKNKVYFDITKSSLQNLPAQNCVGYDIFATGIAGGFKTRVEITDTNGKKLSSKSDYKLTSRYYNSEGQLLTSDYVPEVGDILYAEVEGKGNYTDSIKVSYRVVSSTNNIGAASISLRRGLRKEYTGNRVRLLPDEITVSLGGKELSYGEDFKIIYANNLNKGKATATVVGIGEYGGRKSVKFKIEPMRIKWED